MERLVIQVRMISVLSDVDQLKKDTIVLSMKIRNQHVLRKAHQL